MKMSGTKPMKNTMRKPSPLKFISADTVMSATKKVSDAVGAAAKKAKATKTKALATKPAPVEGKPASRPKASMPKSNPEGKPSAKPSKTKSAFAGAASKAAEVVSKTTKTPFMQMKKSGMGKKC